MGLGGFVNGVARVPEWQEHHADLQVSWGRVVVDLTTHRAGRLTSSDSQSAVLIDRS
jgi:4a-hydroxytetrahydrobiopterin dehydratase